MARSRAKRIALIGTNAPTGSNTGPENSVSEPPAPTMIGPQQPPAGLKLRRKRPFRKLAESGAFGRKELLVRMPKGLVQKLEDEHLAIDAERKALKAADRVLQIEKQAIVLLKQSNPQDPQLPARQASAKQQNEANAKLVLQLNERQSLLRHQCQKMRKDQEKIAEKELYQRVTAELEQTQLEREQMYAEASTLSGDRNSSMQFQNQPLRIGDFRKTEQDLHSQSALPAGDMCMQPDTLQQIYGRGPYGYISTSIDPALTRDHSTLLSSRALKRRDDRRHALNQILFGPLVPLRQRKDQRERLRRATHIDYFPVYPKDSVSMVGLPGMFKETASAVKAEEHTEATMSAVDVNSRKFRSTTQGMGQAELVMRSSDINADEVVQHQVYWMRGNTNANEAAIKHAPAGNSMVGSTDLVESPSAYRLSFQEQSDLSMDGV